VTQPSSACLPVGTLLSHYEIRSVLGMGGMGIVYRAVDRRLDREVALKCVRPDHLSDPEYRRRLLNEARAASRLVHPNIVGVLDVFEVDGSPAVVMDLIEGSSLSAILARRGTLDTEEVLGYSEDLANALAAAHDKHILHRDIKPGNVLISLEGRALLADFGLARRTHPEEGIDISAITTESVSGTLVGTPGYMSPDQLLGRPLDARSDIFSLGIVMYEMCTGSKAFQASRAGGLIDATLHREPVAIARLNYGAPAELERIVRKAMAKRPDERYQGARELLADLRACRRRTGPVPTPEGDSSRQAVVVRALLVTAAAGLVLTGGLLAWRSFANRGDRLPIPTGTSQQLTSGPGLKLEPGISPDGNFVAYASDETGDFELWMADIASGQTLRLTNDPSDDRKPVWLPDNSAIVFVSDRGGGTGIWKIPRLGGSPVLMVPNAIDPAPSPDGRSLAFARAEEGGRLRLWIAPLADLTAARALPAGAARFWDLRRPSWSPDGTLLCYEDYDGLWLVAAENGQPRRLHASSRYEREAAWSPDGRHIYYSSQIGEARALWRTGVEDGRAERLTLGTAWEGEPSLSLDGRRLAYATRQDQARIVLLDLRTGDRVQLPDLRHASFPVIDPKGHRVVFTSDRLGRSDLWSVSMTPAPADIPRQLTDVGGIGTIALSPDGRFTAFHRSVDAQRDIWVAPIDGGPPVNLTHHPAADLHPAWSPDGRTLAFTSNREGHQNIWLLPMQGDRAAGPPVQLIREAKTDLFPAWAPRGDAIAYIAWDGDDSDVWTTALDGVAAPRRLTTGAHASRVHWAGTSAALLVSGTWGGKEIEVRRVRLDDGRDLPLAPPLILGRRGSMGDFSVATNGTLLAYVEEEQSGDIWILQAEHDRF
jgi:Tol biopolymer transport system component/tRNA A-37 threonylcarbamoyl transferase component Bud32